VPALREWAPLFPIPPGGNAHSNNQSELRLGNAELPPKTRLPRPADGVTCRCPPGRDDARETAGVVQAGESRRSPV
jgi:hypothetical protein